MEFKEKVVLITGASRGIGREAAIKFAHQGASVIINYRSNEEAAYKTLNQLEGKKHMIYQADVSTNDEIKKMVGDVIKAYGQIDVLVNNAGIFIDQEMGKITFEQWNRVWEETIQINLIGVANLSFLVGQQMMKQRFGSIVNVSSRGAFRGEPDNPAYGASKGGLNSLSQSLAKAFGKYNISVTAVAPGFVETDMGKASLESEKGEFLRNESPFGRVAKPEEVADTILFLASDKAKFLSGGIVDINGASFLRL